MAVPAVSKTRGSSSEGQINRTVRAIVFITESVCPFRAGRAYVGFVGPAQPMLK